MKNATENELASLRLRAKSIARRLPRLERGSDGLLTPESLDLLRAPVERILRENRTVGASVVLLSPGAAHADVLCSGYARLSPRLPVTPQTCFRVASVSKLVLSFAALCYVQQGVLSLDEDISVYTGFPVRHPLYPDVPITLRMLLTHTSGICDEGSYGTRGMQADCTLPELLADKQNWRGKKPGDSFHYSNLGAGTAGCIVELAAGKPLNDCLQDTIASPLGIRAAYDPRMLAPFFDQTQQIADGYRVIGILPPRLRYDARAVCHQSASPFDPLKDYHTAAGRLITDSAGMAQLLRLLASHDGCMNGRQILRPDLLALMRTPQDGMGGVSSCGRGLNTAFLPGVFSGGSVCGHQGVAYGMCAELFADPHSGCGVGVMTSGTRFVRLSPLMRTGFDLLALGFSACYGGF